MRWRAMNANSSADDWRVRDEDDQDVLTLRFAHRADHAHLAAAAPQMLAVLEHMAVLTARNAEVPHEVRAEAWRVIAKAKGDAPTLNEAKAKAEAVMRARMEEQGR